MDRVTEGCFRFLSLCLALCLGVMVVLVFGNVVMRYAFNGGITLSEELSRWLFVYLTFLGAVVALREHAHLGMDIVVRRLPPLGKKLCYLVSHLLMLWVTLLVLKGSWTQTRINLDSTAPSSGLPMAVFYAPGVVFGVCAAAILLAELFRLLRGKLREVELVTVKESGEDVIPAAGTPADERDDRTARVAI